MGRPGVRSTLKYRGVYHLGRTGRFGSQIRHSRKQVYLGSFDTEEQAALAWDLAAVKLHGHTAATNFPISNYEQELEHQDSVTKEELVLQLRRQGKGMRGPSTPTPSTPTPGYTYKKGRRKYKGVSELKHRHGVWEAFIHQVGQKENLGYFLTEREAAEAYDCATVTAKGMAAQTNFEITNYMELLSVEDQNSVKEQQAVKLAKTAAGGKPMPQHDWMHHFQLPHFLSPAKTGNCFAAAPVSPNPSGYNAPAELPRRESLSTHRRADLPSFQGFSVNGSHPQHTDNNVHVHGLPSSGHSSGHCGVIDGAQQSLGHQEVSSGCNGLLHDSSVQCVSFDVYVPEEASRLRSEGLGTVADRAGTMMPGQSRTHDEATNSVSENDTVLEGDTAGSEATSGTQLRSSDGSGARLKRTRSTDAVAESVAYCSAACLEMPSVPTQETASAGAVAEALDFLRPVPAPVHVSALPDAVRLDASAEHKIAQFEEIDSFFPDYSKAPSAAARSASAGKRSGFGKEAVRGYIECQKCGKPRAYYCSAAWRKMYMHSDEELEKEKSPKKRKQLQEASRDRVRDAILRVCDDTPQFVCGASMSPPDHPLHSSVLTRVGLECTDRLEVELYKLSDSTQKRVQFDTSLCGFCGVEVVKDIVLKDEPGVLPRCDTCMQSGAPAVAIMSKRGRKRVVKKAAKTIKRRARARKEHAEESQADYAESEVCETEDEVVISSDDPDNDMGANSGSDSGWVLGN